MILEQMTIGEYRNFWINIQDQCPKVFEKLGLWLWEKMEIKIGDYIPNHISNLYKFFHENGIVMNPNPQFIMMGDVYFHPQLMIMFSKQTMRFNEHFDNIEMAEHFLLLRGLEKLEVILNQKYARTN